MISGIYCIENAINNKKYIGKTEDIKARFKSHINAFNRGDTKYENEHLLYSWKKYGEYNFKFYIIEECDKKDLIEKEIYYIKKLNTKHPNGYNFTDGGEGISGYKHTKESMKKMTGKNNHMFGKTGNKHPGYGKQRSKETKEKLRNCFLKEKSPVFGTKHKGCASNFFGVGLYRQKQIIKGKQYINTYWTARLRVDRKDYRLGYFKDEILAAKAYDSFVIKNNLKNPLNFPIVN